MPSAARFIFTERDLGKKFQEMLRAGDLNVERHADHFQHDTPDEVWLREVGRKGRIATTHDGRIRYKPNEVSTVMQNGVAVLVVVVMHPILISRAFVATTPRILSFIARQRGTIDAEAREFI